MKPPRPLLPWTPGSRLGAVAVVLLVLAGTGAPVAADAPSIDADRLVGKTLADALAVFQDAGLPVIFSSALVRPSMEVATVPRGDDARALVADLLRSHGLTLVDGPGGRLVVVRAAPTAELPDPPPETLPITRETIEVASSSRDGGAGELPAVPGQTVPGGAEALPHLASDPLRGAGLLPGAANTETSSRLSIRGGRPQDVTVRLDGLELVAPYHLPEFDQALGIVPAHSVGRVELITESPPVEYGDRMGGVLDLTSRTPREPLTLALGLGSLFGEASVGGMVDSGARHWLAAARAGNYRLALEADGRQENPRYWDAFGRYDQRLGPGQDLQLRALVARDEYEAGNGSMGFYESRWDNGYLWLSHSATLGAGVSAESLLWGGRLERFRRGTATSIGATRFDLADDRTFELIGGRSVWRHTPAGGRWSVDGGVELRQIRSSIDYRASRSGEGPVPMSPSPERRFSGRFDFDQLAGFASLRGRAAEGLTVDAGVRWDHTDLTDEEHLSPRLQLAWRPGSGDRVVRATWGRFVQSQRPYELQVEDGETRLAPAERSEQWSLSWESPLGEAAVWRLGAFHRRIDNPRPRFESLFDTAVVYPELSPGRVLLEPGRSHASGLELALSGRVRRHLTYSLVYTLSSATDRIDGRRVPWATDEPHALRLEGVWRLPRDWWIGAVWHYHTGWPTTSFGPATSGDGSGAAGDELVFGPIRDERLPAYHRLDLRLGRSWSLATGRLGASLDIQNLYDWANVRGFEGFEVGVDADGRAVVEAEPVSWGGFFPSFTVRWSL